MITENYVSYEIAQLLKEKGFDEICAGYYNKNKRFDLTLSKVNNTRWDGHYISGNISAPTHQMVLKWLREVHKIHIYIDIEEDRGYQPNVINLNTYVNLISDMYNGYTYEQAVEAALKYTLENLI